MVTETQYEKIKKQHPDAIILFRDGDFYEAYENDASDMSKILGLSLTKTPMGRLIAGFPKHAFDSYLPKMIRAGRRVAIAEEETIEEETTTSTKTTSSIMEETITTKEQKFAYFPPRQEAYYIWDDSAKQLLECVHSFTNYDFAKGNAWSGFATPDGRQYTFFDTDTNAFKNIYKSKHCFECGEPVVVKWLTQREILKEVRIDITKHHVSLNTCRGGSELYIHENGEAVEVSQMDVYPCVEYNPKDNSAKILNGKYDVVYSSVKDCYDHNEYKYMDQNGNVRTEVGKYKLIELTPEQAAICAQIKELVSKACKMGVSFFHSNDSDGVIAYNSLNVDNHSCENEFEEDDNHYVVSLDDNFGDLVIDCYSHYELYFHVNKNKTK